MSIYHICLFVKVYAGFLISDLFYYYIYRRVTIEHIRVCVLIVCTDGHTIIIF